MNSPQDLDKRIDEAASACIDWDIETFVTPEPVKQLIADCIAAVTPDENSQCADDNLNGTGCDPKDHAYREGYNAAIADMEQRAEGIGL